MELTVLNMLSMITVVFLSGSNASPLRVGFASVDITPDPATQKVWLAGFSRGRQAQTVHDPIVVRACVLENSGKKLAFACPDLIGLFDEQVRGAEERLKSSGFETIVSVTHNHHGPDTLGLWGPGLASGIDPKYLKRVEDGIVQAVEEAAKGWNTADSSLNLERTTVFGPKVSEYAELNRNNTVFRSKVSSLTA